MTKDRTLSLAAETPISGAQLLVIDGPSSLIVPLPDSGTVTLGRAPDCEVRLADAACSRRHARLHVDDDVLTLEDLGSHNGTRINGQRVEGRHPLASDDVISIGPIKLVIHARQRPHRLALLESGALRARLAQEVERAVSYQRPLGVAVIAVDEARAAAPVLIASLRFVDVIGILDERHLVIAMPELVPQAVRMVADRLLATAERAAIGLASCPADACTPDALVAAARAAARSTGVHDAAECVQHIELACGTALVADAAMIQIYDLIKRLASSEISVLVSGETGVGKENVARALHDWSGRTAGPFVAINCASLPETLLESELFGHEKGAFSGATASKVGRLEAANGGTVFFDEIGELPLGAQAKLLRVLETRRVTRVGGLKELPVDVRLVAATNRDLETEIEHGRFRQDLYFRLGGAKVVLPPLRDRPRELAILARFFFERACTAGARGVADISSATLAALANHRWPGNVRELKNEMEYLAATTANETVVEPWHLSERIPTFVSGLPASQPPVPYRETARDGLQFRPINDELRDLERRRMLEALAACGGVQKRAAELIAMPLRTFTLKYKQYGLGGR